LSVKTGKKRSQETAARRFVLTEENKHLYGEGYTAKKRKLGKNSMK